LFARAAAFIFLPSQAVRPA